MDFAWEIWYDGTIAPVPRKAPAYASAILRPSVRFSLELLERASLFTFRYNQSMIESVFV